MKPTVFNYQEYEKVVEENKKLKAEVANLLIRCRIAESDKLDIVRCKDCKHRYEYATNEIGEAKHYYVCDFMDAQYKDDGYCSHGERREDGEV